MGQETNSSDKLEMDDKPISNSQTISNPTNKDVYDFLNTLDGGTSNQVKQ